MSQLSELAAVFRTLQYQSGWSDGRTIEGFLAVLDSLEMSLVWPVPHNSSDGTINWGRKIVMEIDAARGVLYGE